MATLEQFKKAWYAKHVSHNANFDRDRADRRFRGSVLTARSWRQVVERTKGSWQIAATNQCLPTEL